MYMHRFLYFFSVRDIPVDTVVGPVALPNFWRKNHARIKVLKFL